MGADGETGQQRAFNQLVRVVAHDFPVLAGPGLALVRVYHQEVRAWPLFLGHERPFHAGREAGAATAAQAGRLDLVDDRLAALGHQGLGPVPVAARAGAGQADIGETVEVREDAVFIAEHYEAPGPALISVRVVAPPSGSQPLRLFCGPGFGVWPIFKAMRMFSVLVSSRSS